MRGCAYRARVGALASLATLAACQSSFEPTLPAPGEDILVAFDQNLAPWPRAGWRLKEARLGDTRLVLTVDYTGGCEEHLFWLLATEGFTELPSAGPVPTVSVPLLLAHDDRGDACDALPVETLAFDLLPLRDEYRRRFGTGPVTIVLRVPEGQGAAGEVLVSWEPGTG